MNTLPAHIQELRFLSRGLKRRWKGMMTSAHQQRMRRGFHYGEHATLPHADQKVLNRALQNRTSIDWATIVSGNERVLVIGERHTDILGIHAVADAIPILRKHGFNRFGFELFQNPDGALTAEYAAKSISFRRPGHFHAYQQLFDNLQKQEILPASLHKYRRLIHELMVERDFRSVTLDDLSMALSIRSLVEDPSCGRIAILVGAAHMIAGGIPSMLNHYGISHTGVQLVGGMQNLRFTEPDLFPDVPIDYPDFTINHMANELGIAGESFQLKFPKRTPTQIRWAIHLPQLQPHSVSEYSLFAKSLSNVPPNEKTRILKALKSKIIRSIWALACELSLPDHPQTYNFLQQGFDLDLFGKIWNFDEIIYDWFELKQSIIDPSRLRTQFEKIIQEDPTKYFFLMAVLYTSVYDSETQTVTENPITIMNKIILHLEQMDVHETNPLEQTTST